MSSFTMLLLQKRKTWGRQRTFFLLNTPGCSAVGQARAAPGVAVRTLTQKTPRELAARSPAWPSVSLVLLPTAGCSLGLGHGCQSPESPSPEPALGRLPQDSSGGPEPS